MIAATVRTSPPTMSQMLRSGYTGPRGGGALKVSRYEIAVIAYRMPSQLGVHEDLL